ncbi:MAG: hypothetical protein QY327_06390 [Fimbriimonadaceae bacterium]|nr:MAG: hypothetical protein QY327_06390 [Fimbriimonadaceae bacterium]
MRKKRKRLTRKITARSRKNIEEKLDRFFNEYASGETHVAVTFPPEELKGIGGQRVKAVARTIQRLLVREFGVKGYRLIEFSKHKKTQLCDIPHFHFVVDGPVAQDDFEALVSNELGWGRDLIRDGTLILIKKGHAGLARYLAKTNVPKDKRCDSIPSQFGQIRRVFDGFGWRVKGASTVRPKLRPKPFGPGGRGFRFRKPDQR